MVVVKLPYFQKSNSLRLRLSKGLGHNYMGEPAWPNDILYIFPVVTFGLFSVLLGLVVSQPYCVSEPANAGSDTQ